VHVQFQVQPHPRFRRRGADLISKLPLKLSEALLGCEKVVETVWGPRPVSVPQGTQNGANLPIAGAGAPRLGESGRRGNHICEVEIVMPKRLSKQQQEVIAQLKGAGL
jgi:molecular chaperone DnaJ